MCPNSRYGISRSPVPWIDQRALLLTPVAGFTGEASVLTLFLFGPLLYIWPFAEPCRCPCRLVPGPLLTVLPPFSSFFSEIITDCGYLGGP